MLHEFACHPCTGAMLVFSELPILVHVAAEVSTKFMNFIDLSKERLGFTNFSLLISYF